MNQVRKLAAIVFVPPPYEVKAIPNKLVIIIIDEYENAAEYQILLNSLLKQVDAKIKVTYRIGVRPQGMVTMETRVGNEFLQINRDYILCQLRSDNMLKYKKFIANIANIRLNSNQTYVELGLTNIEELLGNVDNSSLDKKS